MSHSEYIIGGYSVEVGQEATHVFLGEEWVGSRETREDAVKWIYGMHRTNPSQVKYA